MVKIKMSKKLARVLARMIQGRHIHTTYDPWSAENLTCKQHEKLWAEFEELAVSLAK